MIKQTVIASMLVLTAPIFASGDVTAPQVPQLLESKGVGSELTAKSFANLELFLNNFLKEREISLSGDDKVAKKAAKDAIPFLQFAIEKLAASKNKDKMDQASAYIIGKRIIYSIVAQETMNRSVGMMEGLGIIKKITTSMPNVEIDERDRIVGLEQAAKESTFLVGQNGNYLSVDDLAKMSVNEIADLGISDNHPLWHSEKYLATAQKDSWTKIEKWSEKKMKKKIEKKISIEAANEYSIDRAKKVLFFDEIKTSATSPKVNVYDAYGEKWKLKWGNEVQVEPVANKIYLKMGAKFADLVYTNARGVDGTVLVLGDPTQAGSCSLINSYDLLKQCLLDSKYNFNIDPYTLEKGVINEANVEKVLRNLTTNGTSGTKKSDLLGRTYLTFHESMVEFKGSKGVDYGGPIPGSFFGSEEDRVARGLLIFNMWIKNIDSKDENNKNVILNDLYVDGDQYIEYQHDLGASLGALGQSGSMDAIADSSFARNTNSKIIFDQFMLYRPKAWMNITFADGLWMAKKIARITKQDLDQMLKDTKWPEFYQKIFVRKLLARRNKIAEVFGISEMISAEERKIDIMDIKIDLSSKDARRDAAVMFNIELAKLERLMKKTRLLDRNNVSQYVDTVVKNNHVVGCESSIIVNLLESGPNPSGIKRRIERAKDYKPLPACEFFPGIKTDSDEENL